MKTKTASQLHWRVSKKLLKKRTEKTFFLCSSDVNFKNGSTFYVFESQHFISLISRVYSSSKVSSKKYSAFNLSLKDFGTNDWTCMNVFEN